MIAFKNTTYTKAQAVAMMREHARLDHIIKGTYGEGESTDFKGCLVGCATHGKHELFPGAFGIPEQFAHIADEIFERLPEPENVTFAVDFFEAVPDGADLSRAYDRWLAWLLGDPVDGLVATSKEPRVAAMATLFQRAGDGDEPSADEWAAAARAARAAWAAWAAWAARDAWAAWDARAARAAWAAPAIKSRDKLLEILRTSPVAEQSS